MDRQYAILVFGTHFGTVSILRERETPHEAPISSFNAVILLAFLFFLVLPFSRDTKDILLDRDLDVFLLHIRNFRLDEIFLVVFGDVDERRPFGDRHRFFSSFRTQQRAPESSRKAFLHVFQFLKRIPQALQWFPWC